MPAPPPTVSRLSTISTQTLSSCLELTRLHQLEMAAPAHLSTTIQRNLSQLARGIASLEDAGETSHEVLVGLRGQFERIVGLVEPLGVVVEERLREPEAAGKTGRLVETDDEARPFGDDDSDDGSVAKSCISVKLSTGLTATIYTQTPRKACKSGAARRDPRS